MFLTEIWVISDGMTHFSKSDKETISSTSLITWEGAHFQQKNIFWGLIKTYTHKENNEDFDNPG